MKGTLLLLALLVTMELSFQTTEACAPFFQAFTAMASGNRALMHEVLTTFNGTAQEMEAFDKIQECYNEAGLIAKIIDSIVLKRILFSSTCLNYYTTDTIGKILTILSKLTSM